MGYSGKTGWSDAAMALALLGLGVVLCILGTGLVAQWQDGAARRQDLSVEVLLAAAATAAGIGLLLWWAFALLSAGAAVLLQRSGRRRAAAVARRLSPAFMQRAVVAALSIQLVAGAAAHAATAPGPEWTPLQNQSSAAPSNPATMDAVPAPGQGDGPDMHTPVQQVPAEVPTAVRDGASPAWQPAAAQPTAATVNPGWQPASPVVEPGLLAAPQTRATAGPEAGGSETGGGAGVVTVLAGDTLWDIVAAQLGPEASDVAIALEWPRWYAANRGLIGASPDVLLPGQILHAPAP